MIIARAGAPSSDASLPSSPSDPPLDSARFRESPPPSLAQHLVGRWIGGLTTGRSTVRRRVDPRDSSMRPRRKERRSSCSHYSHRAFQKERKRVHRASNGNWLPCKGKGNCPKCENVSVISVLSVLLSNQPFLTCSSVCLCDPVGPAEATALPPALSASLIGRRSEVLLGGRLPTTEL